MSKYFIEGETLTDIADQLRLELDTTQTYAPEDMPLAIHLAASQGGGGGGDKPWTLVDDVTLSEDTSYFDIPISSPDEILVVFSFVINTANQWYVSVNNANSSSHWLGNTTYAAAGARWGCTYIARDFKLFDFPDYKLSDRGNPQGLTVYGSNTSGASTAIPDFPPALGTSASLKQAAHAGALQPWTTMRIGAYANTMKAGSRFRIYTR